MIISASDLINNAIALSGVPKMRDRAALDSMPIVPDPNYSGQLRGYRQQWTVPSVEDLARNRPPRYLPGDDPAGDNPTNSPWLPNYRRETPRSLDPQSSLPESMFSPWAWPASSSALKALMAHAALGDASGASGVAGRGSGALAPRPRGPAVLFDLGASSQAPSYGEQTRGGGLLGLLAELMAANPDDRSSRR